MRNFLDNIEDAAAKLQNYGEQTLGNIRPAVSKVVDTAKDACEKARPAIEDGIEQVGEFFQKKRPIIEDGFESAVESTRSALDRAIDSLQENAPDDAQAAETPAAPPALKEQIDLEVAAQLEKLRSAQTSSPFSDFISKKYGKKEQ